MKPYRDLDNFDMDREDALIGDYLSGEAPYVPVHRKSFRGTDHPQPVTRPYPRVARTDKPDDVTSSASSGPCPSSHESRPGGTRNGS